MSKSHRSSSASATCQLEWRPSRWVTAWLLAQVLLVPICLLASGLPRLVAWPVALAATREEAGTIAALLDGGVRGYEAMVTVGRMFDDAHYALWHPTSTAGGFGAAAAAR